MPLNDTGFRDRCEPLDKIDRVIDLLATEDRWCQGQLVTALHPRRNPGGRWARVLIRPVAIAIRQVTGRRFGLVGSYIIPRFNDDRGTTHALVMTVLCQARENIIRGIAEDNGAVIWQRRWNRLRQHLPIGRGQSVFLR